MNAADARVGAIEAILAREGIAGSAAVAGFAGDVAAVRVAPEALARLAELAPEIKALGFRYVALELPADQPSGEGEDTRP